MMNPAERKLVHELEEALAKDVPKMTDAINALHHSYSVPLVKAAKKFEDTDKELAEAAKEVAAKELAAAAALAAPRVAAKGGGVLVEGAGTGTRALNVRPKTTDPDWGLTETHREKHLSGDDELFSLKHIDPGGSIDTWFGHIQDLASRAATKKLKGGIEDIIGIFPKTGGGGSYRFGIRIAPGKNGTFDLVTMLTKQ